MALSLLGLLGTLIGPNQARADRPNVVLIIGDDQAWSDYGFMGHPHVKTPHLDALAREGLVFSRGYVAAPLCRPSLASIVTGRFPQQHGVVGNDVDGHRQRAALDPPVRARFHQWPSLVRTLTEHGYRTHQSGKWWEGSYQDGGFSDGMTHGDPTRGGRHGDAGLTIGRQGLEPIFTFIEQAAQSETPFFVWYAPFLPHTPHNPPRHLLQHYLDLGLAKDVARYYAMCQWFDETCGALIEFLDKKQLREDTLILTICDNGWAAPSTNAGDERQGRWKRYALRSKSSPYENGVRTPILVSWPQQVPPGTSQQLAHAVDIFPTVAAATGIPVPTDLPGINLMDASAVAARKAVFGVCHATHNMTVGNPDDTLQYLWCVDGPWKLIVRHHGKDTTEYHVLHDWDTAELHLFHVGRDPHEQQDVAADHPDVVARLRQAIREWRTATGTVEP